MIIRIHNTGDPYKLPTLSVHIYIYIYRRGGLFLFLFSRVPFFFSLSLPLPLFPPFPTSVLANVSWQQPLRQIHRSMPFFLPSPPPPLAHARRRHVACSVSFLLLSSPGEHRHTTVLPTYPTVRCSRTMALFFFYTWYLISNSLSLSLPVRTCTALWHRVVWFGSRERKRDVFALEEKKRQRQRG